MDGPMPRPRDGCLSPILFVWILILASALLGYIAKDVPEPKNLCQCGGDECPYTDHHVPKEPDAKAEMHYWSIQ